MRQASTLPWVEPCSRMWWAKWMKMLTPLLTPGTRILLTSTWQNWLIVHEEGASPVMEVTHSKEPRLHTRQLRYVVVRTRMWSRPSLQIGKHGVGTMDSAKALATPGHHPGGQWQRSSTLKHGRRICSHAHFSAGMCKPAVPTRALCVRC